MTAATDTSPCPRCSLHAVACQLANEDGHAWDGRHQTYDPRAMRCSACGHRWIESDLDAVAKNWRAQAAHYVNALAEAEATRRQLGLPPKEIDR